MILQKGVRDNSDKVTFGGDLGEVREQRPGFISTNVYKAADSGCDLTNWPHNFFPNILLQKKKKNQPFGKAERIL